MKPKPRKFPKSQRQTREERELLNLIYEMTKNNFWCFDYVGALAEQKIKEEQEDKETA